MEDRYTLDGFVITKIEPPGAVVQNSPCELECLNLRHPR
jgi:hypothetical protein